MEPRPHPCCVCQNACCSVWMLQNEPWSWIHAPARKTSTHRKLPTARLITANSRWFGLSSIYVGSVRLPPFGHLLGQQLFGAEAHQSERGHVAADHPVEQPLQQTHPSHTHTALVALQPHHVNALTLFFGSFRLNIKDLYLFLYLLSVFRHRLNISFSIANASRATSLSVIFRSSLSLTLVVADISVTVWCQAFAQSSFFVVWCDSHLLYRMSVSERRMFCLIWLFGGGGMGDAGGAEEAE